MGLQLSLLELEPPQIPAKAPSSRIRSIALEQADKAIEGFAAPAHSARTQVAYQSAWHRFEPWCETQVLVALPAEPKTLARYLAVLAELGRRPSTMQLAARAFQPLFLRIPFGQDSSRLCTLRGNRSVTFRPTGAGRLGPASAAMSSARILSAFCSLARLQ